MAKTLIFLGLGLIALGAIIWLLGLCGINFGKLPGDVSAAKGKVSVYFPITTCIIISIILTILLNLFFWLKK